MLVWFVFLSFMKVGSLSNVTIKAPTVIEALGNDFAMAIAGVLHGDVIELFYEDGLIPLSGQIITSAHKIDETILVFNCGYFSQPGDYLFVVKRSRDEDISILDSIGNFHVTATKWSDLTIQLKSSHEAYSGDVKVTVISAPHVCHSEVVNRFPSKMILLRDNSTIMAIQDVTFPPTLVIFECDKFSQNGSYVVQLWRKTVNDDMMVTQSDAMDVYLSNDYDINIPEVIYPCTGSGIQILLEKPPCAPPDDYIQVTAFWEDSSTTIISNLTVGASDVIEFPCELLLKTYLGVCFHYLTSSVAVRTTCRPINIQDFTINAQWSSWTSWFTCSRPCSYPIHQRLRSCDNPKKRGRGLQCDERGLYKEYQLVSKKNSDILNLCSHNVTTERNSSECFCGCHKFITEKTLIVAPIAGECEQHLVVEWKLYAPLTFIIRLEIIDLVLKDGETLLLIQESISKLITSLSEIILTNDNKAVLKYERSPSHKVPSCGFVIAIESTKSNSFVQTTWSTVTEGSDWFEVVLRNPVVAIAVCLCLLLVLLVVAFTFCRSKKQHNDRPIPIGALEKHPTPQAPRAAYYLAQRQLQLMKREGKKNSSQMYTSLCMNDENIHKQETLLFGSLPTYNDTKT